MPKVVVKKDANAELKVKFHYFLLAQYRTKRDSLLEPLTLEENYKMSLVYMDKDRLANMYQQHRRYLKLMRKSSQLPPAEIVHPIWPLRWREFSILPFCNR